MITILENGTEMEVTDERASILEKADLIYWCNPVGGGCFSDGTGCGFYHVNCDVAGYPDSPVEEKVMWSRLEERLKTEGKL